MILLISYIFELVILISRGDGKAWRQGQTGHAGCVLVAACRQIQRFGDEAEEACEWPRPMAYINGLCDGLSG